MVTPFSRAWDRRDGETVIQFRRFQSFLSQPRNERSRYLSTRPSSEKKFASQNDWHARAAAYDDAEDRDFEAMRLEAVREMRQRHALVGRAMLNLAVGRLREVTIWKTGDLIRLAELAAKMERLAYFGSLPEMQDASRVAVAANGVPVDEWDRLAQELSGTIPRASG